MIKQSKYVDHNMTWFAKGVKTYIFVTMGFLNKINIIKTIQQKTIFVTMDVSYLYSNTKHNERISTLEEHVKKKIIRNPLAEVKTKLLQHIITINNFNFNCRHFISTKRYDMGTGETISFITSYEDKF